MTEAAAGLQPMGCKESDTTEQLTYIKKKKRKKYPKILTVALFLDGVIIIFFFILT